MATDRLHMRGVHVCVPDLGFRAVQGVVVPLGIRGFVEGVVVPLGISGFPPTNPCRVHVCVPAPLPSMR